LSNNLDTIFSAFYKHLKQQRLQITTNHKAQIQ
jgi:hypothetical protein